MLDQHLVSPVEYLVFVCGLGAASLTAVALHLRRVAGRMPWIWLAAFAGSRAVHYWVGLIEPGPQLLPMLATARVVLGVAAYGFLLEFARRSAREIWGRAPAAWIGLPLVALQACGFWWEWPWPLDTSLAGMGAVAALAMALVLFAPLPGGARTANRWLRPAGLLLFVGVMAGTAAPWFERWFGSASVGGGIGGAALAPLLSEGLTLLAAGALALHLLRASDGAGRRTLARLRVLLSAGTLLSSLLILGLGWLLVRQVGVNLPAIQLPLARSLGALTTLAQFLIVFAAAGAWRAAVEAGERIRRADESLLNTIVESAGDGLLVADASGRIVLSNARLADMWRIPRELLYRWDDDLPLEQVLGQVQDPGELLSTVGSLYRSSEEQLDVLHFKDGRVFQRYSRRLPAEASIAGRVWSFRDISHHPQAEGGRRDHTARLERQSVALARLARLRLEGPTDLAPALRQITETSAVSLDLELVSVWLFFDGQSELRCEDSYERSRDRHTRGTVTPREALSGYLDALEGEPVLAISEVREDPLTRDRYREELAPRGIASLLIAPLRLHGSIVGLISHAHTGTPRTWSSDEKHFVTALADLAALMLEVEEHRRIERGLEELHAFQQQVIDVAATAVYVVDAEGRITGVNEALCAITGYLPEDLVGRHHSVLGEGRCGEDCTLLRGRPERNVFRHQCMVCDRDGETLEVIRNATVMRNAEGEVTGALISFADVTELASARKEAEEALARAEAARDEVLASKSQSQDLESELQRARAAQRTAEEAVETAQGQLAKLHGEYAALREEGVAEETQRTALREELAETRQALETQQAELEKARAGAGTLQAELAEAHAALERSEQARAPEREELQAACTTAEALGAQVTELEQALEAEQAARRSMAATGDEAQREISQVRTELEAARAALRRAEEAQASARQEQETLRESIDEDLQAARADAETLGAKVAELERALQAERGARQSIEVSGDDTRQELARAREATRTLQAELEEARQALAGRTQQHEAANQELEEARQVLGRLQGELEEARAASGEESQSLRAAAEADARAREAQWRTERAEQDEAYEVLRRRAAELEERLSAETTARQATGTAADETQRELARALEEQGELRAALERVQGERETASEALETARTAVRDVERAVAERVAEVAAARGEITDLQTLASRLEAERQTAHEEIEQLRTSAGQTQSELDTLRQAQDELDALRQTHASIEEGRAEAQATADRLETERAEVQATLTRLEAEQVEAQQALGGLRQELEQAQREAEEARAESGHLQAELGRVQRQVRKLPPEPELTLASPPVEEDEGPTPIMRAAVQEPQGPQVERAEGEAIDSAALLARLSGDRELAANRALAFQKGSAWMVTRLRDAVRRKNARGLEAAARAMRKALDDVAALAGIELAEQIAAAGRDQDFGRADPLVKMLEAEVDRVRSALTAFRRAA